MDRLEFKKLIRVLAFFAFKNNGSIDKLKAIKLLFFADRYHIRKYGRPVVWTNYVAMDYGPVSSETLDLINDIVLGRKFFGKDVRAAYEYLAKDSDNGYCLVKKINEGDFESSELEALEFSWNTFGYFSGSRLIKLTHVYPEWKKYEPFFKNTYGSRKNIDLRDFFKDPSPKEKIFRELKCKTDPFRSIKSDFAEQELKRRLAVRKVNEWRKSPTFLKAKEQAKKMKKNANLVDGEPVPKVFIENQLKVLKSRDC